MPGDFLEGRPRDLNSKLMAGLTNEAREAVNTALKALSTWRSEIVETNEKNGKRVIEKMAAAATALGWPEQIVDVARSQLQNVANAQVKNIDQVMNAWEEQIKLPDAMTAPPSAMLSKLKSFSALNPTAGMPSTEAFQNLTTNPLQLWMQMAEHSQKVWADTITLWSKAAKPN